MKTILKDGNYLRVNDDLAESFIKTGSRYVPKSEWKKNVRDLKTESEKVESETNQKTKSKKLEKRLKLKEKQKSI